MADDPLPPPGLFVQLGILTADQLSRCEETQRRFRQEGLPMDLAHVILQMQIAGPEKVARVLVHLGTAVLRCPTCKRRFTVPDFQANRRYKCGTCKAYLEVVPEEILKPRETSPANRPAPPRTDPMVGRTFGKFRATKRLAKGGMGMVYTGEHVENGRKVAIKILTEEYSKMPGIQARFRREGEAGLRLAHENLVEVLDMAVEGNSAYIVTEFVEGGSLEDLVIKEKKLAPSRAAAILCDMLAGLQQAHERGLAHRDIKPANVLLTPEGRAKVIDFGLAMDAEAQTILTMAGAVMGTPSFMSPEQARGERGGNPSDLYACGLVTYLLLTGRKPFEGKGLMDVLNKQINEPMPPAKALNPEVPESLDRVLAKLTAKDAAKRYKDAATALKAVRAAMGMTVPEAEELEELAAPVPISPSPAAARARHPALFWSLVGAWGFVVILITLLLLRQC